MLLQQLQTVSALFPQQNFSCELRPRQRPYCSPNDIPTQCTALAQIAYTKLPHQLYHVGKSSAGPDFQYSFNKNPTSDTVKTLISPTNFMSDSFLAWDLELTLKAGIYAGAYWESTITQSDAVRVAKQFVARLKAGTGTTWHDREGKLSDALKNTPEVKKIIAQVSKDFKTQMHQYGGDFTQITLSKKLRPPSISWTSSPSLKILVGGTQEMIIRLDYICYDCTRSKWLAMISIEIRDDFGVTESDITNPSPAAVPGVPGLMDFWVLQHRRGKKPFTTVFDFSFFIDGSM